MLRLDEEYIEHEEALRLLSTERPHSIIHKSFYNFDFSSITGVLSFLSLLPILDLEVVRQAAAELWPGFVDDSFDLQRAKYEIRGYFMDTIAAGLLVSDVEEAESAEEASFELAQGETEDDVGPSAQTEEALEPEEEAAQEAPGEELQTLPEGQQ